MQKFTTTQDVKDFLAPAIEELEFTEEQMDELIDRNFDYDNGFYQTTTVEEFWAIVEEIDTRA